MPLVLGSVVHWLVMLFQLKIVNNRQTGYNSGVTLMAEGLSMSNDLLSVLVVASQRKRELFMTDLCMNVSAWNIWLSGGFLQFMPIYVIFIWLDT